MSPLTCLVETPSRESSFTTHGDLLEKGGSAWEFVAPAGYFSRSW
jgi:hypothetical protein